MPLYEYKCADCQSVFESMQKANDPPLKKCPKCGGELKKLISAPAIQFKGNGWYITDYAGKKPAAEDKPKVKKEDKAKEDKVKPEAAAESKKG